MTITIEVSQQEVEQILADHFSEFYPCCGLATVKLKAYLGAEIFWEPKAAATPVSPSKDLPPELLA